MTTTATHAYKVCLIGDSGVGKSSLVTRFRGKEFNNYESSTIGAAFSVVKSDLGSKKVELQIWDTAGQERYNSIVPIYLRQAHAVIIVYSVNDKQSQQSIGKKWYRFVHDNSINRIYFVANKSDLLNPQLISEHNVFLENFKKWSSQQNLEINKYYLISAIDNINIQTLYSDIVTDLINSSAIPLNSNKLEEYQEIKDKSLFWKYCSIV
jgi:small GTP-binding protein